MEFSTESSNFEARYVVNTAIQQPSVLYYNPEYWYSTGFTLVLYSGFDQVLTEGKDYIVDLSQTNYAKFTVINQALNGQTLTVQVTPKNYLAAF